MTSTTAHNLAQAAEVLIKLHGYHGFSYADVAERVGIRKASIHHHFKAKQDLATHAVAEYRQRLGDALDELKGRTADPIERLHGFAAIFQDACRCEGAMCLCAALTADWAALPEPVQAEVAGYWNDTRAWLADALFAPDAEPTDRRRAALANAVIALLEGSLLASRVDNDEQPLTDAIEAAEALMRR
ncbi:MAG: TetR/AcrR family transcriptional regulator [Planctomycetota bacterium]